MLKKHLSTELEFVVKATKYCNLRCSYCYEFANLGDKTAISLDNMERMFQNISSYTNHALPLTQEAGSVTFIWHGGEPFMLPMSYYRDIGAIQKSLLNGAFINSVQTNLTIFSDDHLEDLVRGAFFQRLGFSFDVYGDQRVDIRGRSSTAKVIKNIALLREYQIPTGAIAVLSRSTAPHSEKIFQFYDSLGINLRLLPYHIEAVEGQTSANGLHPDEIASAMCRVFDLWLQSDKLIQLLPLADYVDYALNYMAGDMDHYFDKEARERVFIVNTNGDVFGFETYAGEYSYGNAFEQPFEEILYSKTRIKLVRESVDRVDRHCSNCKYFGGCSGYPVAEATPMELRWLDQSGCYAEKVITHIIERFEQCGIASRQDAPAHGFRRANPEKDVAPTRDGLFY